MNTFDAGDTRATAYGESAAHDDELDLEYSPIPNAMPLAVMPGVFGGGGLCEHTFELQAMRVTIENLRAGKDTGGPCANCERLQAAIASWKRDEQLNREEVARLSAENDSLRAERDSALARLADCEDVD
jgi:hypothetical protein